PVPPDGSNTATWTVSLNGPAPPGGMVIPLTSARTDFVTVPSTMTVPAGSSSGTFPVTLVANGRKSNITASLAGNILGGAFGYAATSLTVSPNPIHGNGSSALATVTISDPAPTGGIRLNLRNTYNGIIWVPYTATVPAGHTTVTYPVLTVVDNG